MQQLNTLAFPDAEVLLDPAIQEQISNSFFDDGKAQHLPPLSYQRRVLKTLTDTLEKSIKDPNEDVGSLAIPH